LNFVWRNDSLLHPNVKLCTTENMFTFEIDDFSSPFLLHTFSGHMIKRPDIQASLISYDVHAYSDGLFTQLSIPFSETLKSAVPKRRAEFLTGRYAAGKLLNQQGCNYPVAIGQDRAPVWPEGWHGSISHTEEWAVAVLAPSRLGISLGVDIESLRPQMISEIATTFTSEGERAFLAACGMEYETALLIAFSAKESLFKALYPQVRHFFGFEAARICELEQHENRFTLELTSALAPGLCAGYRVMGQYSIGAFGVITLVVTSDNPGKELLSS